MWSGKRMEYIKLSEEPILPSDIDVPKIMAEDFPEGKSNVYYPNIYSGGWGYEKESAVILTPGKPGTKFQPSNKVISGSEISYEYAFVPMRLYEELIIFRARDDGFAGIHWNPLLQSFKEVDSRAFDILSFSVEAFHEPVWNWLRDDWESHDAYRTDPVGREQHMRVREQVKSQFEAEFWFDITAFRCGL